MRISGIDTLDHAILTELQKDGRVSHTALAEKVGLSVSACLRRVRALEDKGVIERYVAMLNEKASGRPQSVFVQVTLDSQEVHNLEDFEARVVSRAEVMECYLMSGDADYLLRVIVRDAADYEDLHRNFLTRLPHVNRVNSSFALRTITRKTNVPLD